MSDACFHNFDFNRMIYTAISTDDLPSALANLVVKTPFPAFFACLFKSSFTPSEDSAILCELFGQSFANRFLQNRDFFSTHRNSIPYTRGILMCLLGFWPSGPKPCGGNNSHCLARKYIYVLFARWEVRIVKNCDRGQHFQARFTFFHSKDRP